MAASTDLKKAETENNFPYFGKNIKIKLRTADTSVLIFYLDYKYAKYLMKSEYLHKIIVNC